MYYPISIHPISTHQVRKLITGLPTRIIHGHGMTIHVNADQHKKIMRAHTKGKAHTITFDPHQAEMHGSGLMGDLMRKAVKHVKGVVKANIPKAEEFVRAEIAKHGQAGMKIAEHQLSKMGVSPNLSHMIAQEATGHLVHGANKLVDQGVSHAHKMTGEGMRRRTKGGKLSLAKIGKTLDRGFNKIGHQVQHYAPIVGHELQKFGKAHGREILHNAINYGVTPALTALGTATGQPEIALAAPGIKYGLNEGVDALGKKYGFGIKRRGRPRKMRGSALYPS